ncbi:MAG: NAD(P)/FAD-dependent oxidoreductase [Acidimicrobiia bacterium]|nr:NAD(P)/FAD-dependent oxidoreductase [Acidimicrobiia bacterium]
MAARKLRAPRARRLRPAGAAEHGAHRLRDRRPHRHGPPAGGHGRAHRPRGAHAVDVAHRPHRRAPRRVRRSRPADGHHRYRDRRPGRHRLGRAVLGDTVETDLAVAADGIHSATRQLVFGDAQPFDTGWLAWTWWTAPDRFPPTTVREHWGAGRFFGFYPSPTRTMCCAGFPADDLDDEGADTETLRSRIGDALTELRAAEPAIDAAIEAADTFFRWPMADVRADEWSRGRVVLCGDAGVAFLPTAGVGASNALRSAAALADELSRADASTVPLALELYEKRCRKVVEGNQHDSRTVARYMFVESSTLSWGRDRILKHYPATRVIDQIIDSMHQPF